MLDQGSNRLDVSRRDFADPRVLVQAGDEVILSQPDLLDWVPTLEVKNLVKASDNVAGLDSGDDVRAEVNTTDYDVTPFKSFNHSFERPRYARPFRKTENASSRVVRRFWRDISA